MPSEKILQQKKTFVADLRQRMTDASSGVLVDYIGINVEADTALRRELREAGVDYKVVKNTMMHLAVQDTPYAELDEALSGSTALALCGDEDPLAAARILCKYADKSKGAFSVKIGYMDGKIISAEEVAELSRLPGREGLLAMLLSVLTGNLRGLAVGLNAVAEKRTAEEGAPAAAAEEAPAAEAPATEAPATEAPATEAPATEAPAAEEAKAEEPTEEKAEEPAAEEPKAEEAAEAPAAEEEKPAEEG